MQARLHKELSSERWVPLHFKKAGSNVIFESVSIVENDVDVSRCYDGFLRKYGNLKPKFRPEAAN
jgi:hypothetical protein